MGLMGLAFAPIKYINSIFFTHNIQINISRESNMGRSEGNILPISSFKLTKGSALLRLGANKNNMEAWI